MEWIVEGRFTRSAKREAPRQAQREIYNIFFFDGVDRAPILSLFEPQ